VRSAQFADASQWRMIDAHTLVAPVRESNRLLELGKRTYELCSRCAWEQKSLPPRTPVLTELFD